MLGYWGNNNHFHKKKQLSFDTLLGKVKKTRQIIVEGKPFPRSKTQKRGPNNAPKLTQKFLNRLLRSCTFWVRLLNVHIESHILEDVSMETVMGDPIVEKRSVATLESH